MSYNVVIRERFKGGPAARTVQENFSKSISCNTLREVIDEIEFSTREVRSKYKVLQEWCEMDQCKVTKKILFEREGRHGRLLRTITTSRGLRKQVHDDSLI